MDLDVFADQAVLAAGIGHEFEWNGGKHSLVGENIQVHVYRTLTDFFNRQLAP